MYSLRFVFGDGAMVVTRTRPKLMDPFGEAWLGPWAQGCPHGGQRCSRQGACNGVSKGASSPGFPHVEGLGPCTYRYK